MVVDDMRKGSRSAVSRSVRAFLFAVGGLAALVAIALAGCGGDGKVSHTIAVGEAPSDLAIDGSGGVWVVDGDAVMKIDPKKNKRALSKFIPVPEGADGIAFGMGKIWVASNLASAVTPIDPVTNRPSTPIVAGGPTSIAVGEGSIWVTNISAVGSVLRIDPKRRRVVGDPIRVGLQPYGIAVGAGSVWTANSTDDTVSRIDPKTLEVKTIRVGRQPTDVAIGEGAAWVTNSGDDTVSRIDLQANKEIAKIGVGHTPSDVAVGEGAVWVENTEADSVSRIDPKDNKAGKQIDVRGSRPADIAVGDGSVWVAVAESNIVSRIEP